MGEARPAGGASLSTVMLERIGLQVVKGILLQKAIVAIEATKNILLQ